MKSPAAHRIPAIERMMDILGQLELAGGRPTVGDLATSSGVSRTTVYRILNTLEAHRLVVRSGADGGYQLGSRLVTLAARVPHGAEWQAMADSAQPWLQRVARETGETAKLSVLDGDAALCVAVIQGPSQHATAAVLGGRYPLHAGAASKVLLSAMSPPTRQAILAAPLERFTARTVTDPAALRAQLGRASRQGWAEDTGEYSLSVHAVAAPVRGATGTVIAALSVAHFADRTDDDRRSYRNVVCRVAAAMKLVLR
jgi:DNA-binding IclR family transcriptional regulator